MDELTMADLVRILRESAGVGEMAPLAHEMAHVSFGDLGYDSIAIMETASRLKREYGVRLSDEQIVGVDTPADLLSLARVKLAEAS